MQLFLDAVHNSALKNLMTGPAWMLDELFLLSVITCMVICIL